MTFELSDEAKQLNLPRGDYNLLLVVLAWYNARTFEIGEEKHHIGTHHEPALEDLCLAWDVEYDPAAHERLLTAEWLTEETICRRKVDWVPTPEGLEKMEFACEEHAEHVRPGWAGGRPIHSPVGGTGAEAFLHRKGVEIARKMLDFYWLFPIDTGLWESDRFLRYPESEEQEWTHDIEISTDDNWRDFGVEVVTSHDDPQVVLEKWRAFAQRDRRTVWLFEDRVHASKILNIIHWGRVFRFQHGDINKPQNWAVRNLNHRVWKAEKNTAEENGNIIHTVTGMFEASQDEIKTYFEDFYDHAQ